MVAAAVYARISLDELKDDEDPTKGRKGVTRQLEDARTLAAQRGWTIAEEYVDNDVSAYNGAIREAYQRLMLAAESGRFDRIICWQTSRLWRNRVERAKAITRLGQLHIGIAAVKGPELDLASAYGRGLASLVTEFDSMESEIKSERQVRANQQKAEEGKAASYVAYGWTRVRETDARGRIVGFHDVEDPAAADVVREIVQRFLAGESERSILLSLNGRHEPAPRGKDWTYRTLKNVALRPANVALRIHHGEVIGAAAWPAIVSQDDHDRVVALLTDPARGRKRDGGRHHLLSYGVGECGVCGGQLFARTEATRRDKSGPRVAIYRCMAKGCVQRLQNKVDELVGAVVVERLSRPDAAGIFDSDDTAATEARDRAEAVRARLDSAADQYAAGDIDGQQLARITATLRPQLEAAQADARRSRPIAVPVEVDELQGDRAAEVWSALPVTAKRAVLQVLGLSVVIMPRKKSGPGFDPTEIVFRWGR